MDRFYAHDAETGGTDPTKHSLLTYYAGVYTFDLASKKFTLRSEIDLKIKPNDGNYLVTAGALGVNKIDLIKHDSEALTIDQAAEKLYYFLKEHSDDGKNRMVRMGHNEPFDRDFIINNLLKLALWQRFTDYGGILDSSGEARRLKLIGKLPWNVRFNLKQLAEFLGVAVDPKLLHTAKGDTHLMMACFEKMLTM